MPKKDREKIRQLVIEKMSKYVADPSKDIVFGSARIYDSELDEFVRQDVPQLIDKMYDTAGDLGLVVNIINPAEKVTKNINARLYEIREKAARRIIYAKANLCAAWSILPGSSIITTPLHIQEMNIAICQVMGVKKEKILETDYISKVCLQAIRQSIKIEAGWATAAAIIDPLALVLTAVGTYMEWDNNVLRVQAVGEALLEYIRSDFNPIVIQDIKQLLDNMKRKIQEQGLYSSK